MRLPDVEDPTRSAEEIHSEISRIPRWRHRIPVGHGIVTPGTEDTDTELARLSIPDDLAGARVLDVGCSDGYYSFVCENRGAEVRAIDDASSMLAATGMNGFDVAKRLRGSSVDYSRADVHEISPETIGRFDHVLLINVLYHLENPVLALRRLAAVTDTGGSLTLKTYFRTDLRMWVGGRCVGFDLSRRPKFWFFPTDELGGDPTNWWAPNRSGLSAILEATGWGEAEISHRVGDRLYARAVRT